MPFFRLQMVLGVVIKNARAESSFPCVLSNVVLSHSRWTSSRAWNRNLWRIYQNSFFCFSVHYICRICKCIYSIHSLFIAVFCVHWSLVQTVAIIDILYMLIYHSRFITVFCKVWIDVWCNSRSWTSHICSYRVINLCGMLISPYYKRYNPSWNAHTFQRVVRRHSLFSFAFQSARFQYIASRGLAWLIWTCNVCLCLSAFCYGRLSARVVSRWFTCPAASA